MISLNLKDGSAWSFTADAATSPWLHRFARYCRLSGDNKSDSGSIRFVHNRSMTPCDYELCDGPELFGWRALDGGSLQRLRQSATPLRVRVRPNHREPLSGMTSMRYILFPVYERSLSLGGLPVHAGLAVNGRGEGVLLAGDSGAGKSTSCRALLPPWTALCDEETLIVQAPDGRYHGHPMPTWSTLMALPDEPLFWPVQTSVPLQAIFLLEHGAETIVLPLSSHKAVAELYENAQTTLFRYWSSLSAPSLRRRRLELFDRVTALVSALPVMRLRIRLGSRFWEQITASIAHDVPRGSE